MKRITRNIAVDQGGHYEETYVFEHGLRLTKNLVPSYTNPPHAIKVTPLPVDIPPGTILDFRGSACGDALLTTASITPAGETTVQILPYTGKSQLGAGAIASAVPLDLTGVVWTGSCRRKYTDLDPAFGFEFTVEPLAGRVTVSILPASTAALVLADRETFIFSDLPDNLQDKANFSPDLWAKAWFYDAKAVFPTGKVRYPLRGRLWLVVRATV